MTTGTAGGSDASRATALAQPLVGRPLLQPCVGPADVQLNFGRSAAIQLESPVRNDTSEPVSPYGIDELALLLPLLNADVAAVHVDENGELVLAIGGTSIRCAADPHYEAWNLVGSQGERVVCGPAGRLTVWNPRPA